MSLRPAILPCPNDCDVGTGKYRLRKAIILTPNQEFWLQIIQLLITAIVTPLIGVLVAILMKRFATMQKEMDEQGERSKKMEHAVNGLLEEKVKTVGEKEYLRGLDMGKQQGAHEELLRQSSPAAPSPLPVVETVVVAPEQKEDTP